MSPFERVVVVDSGVDRYRTDTAYAEHPDFVNSDGSNQITLRGISAGRGWSGTACANNRGFPPIYTAHGTAVAGIVGAANRNAKGIAGIVRRHAQIIPAQVRESRPNWYFGFAVANALYMIGVCWNQLDNPRIVSISIIFYKGSSFDNYFGYTPIKRAIQWLTDSGGVTVVAAAGNQDQNVNGYPAAFDEVIGVTGLARSYYKAKRAASCEGGSNYGTWYEVSGYYGCEDAKTDLTAFWKMIPTLDISGARGYVGLGDYYSRSGDYHVGFSGTSAAAPMVSGLVALMRSADMFLNFDQVRQIIIESQHPNIDDRYDFVGCRGASPDASFQDCRMHPKRSGRSCNDDATNEVCSLPRPVGGNPHTLPRL
jgi:subtilisin family serine protease